MTDIKCFGVIADGKICETEKINDAVKACAEKGEELFFSDGTYITTTIKLQDNSHIILSEKAVIKASENEEDWADSNGSPLFSVSSKKNIVIEGKGRIDCSGDKYHDYDGNRSYGPRPQTTMLFEKSENIKLYDFTVGNSVGWTVHFNDCDNVDISRVKIRNPEWWCAKSNDGFDINGCRHIKITDCDVEVGDDGICLKNYGFDATDLNDRPGGLGVERKPMFDIVVKNCIVRSTCAALKLGTESQGDMYDISFENIEILDHRQPNIYRHPDFGAHTLAAISININDGSNVHNVKYKNIHATYANTAIYIFMQKRLTKNPNPKMGTIKDILIDGLTVDNAQRANQINIQDGGVAENITIKNTEVHLYEDYTGKYNAIMPEDRWYPDEYAYGHMPAYSLYARNVLNLSYDESNKVYDVFKSGRPGIIIE